MIIAIVVVTLLLYGANYLSYRVLKERLIRNQVWDLNISCGKTDGGGINADIVQHEELPNFVLVEDIYNLPFETGQFERVLCSHTMEHVEDPEAFFAELSRVGKEVTLVLPPLWDLAALFNFTEHKWIFFCLKKKHNQLPYHIPVPFSRAYQEWKYQHIRA